MDQEFTNHLQSRLEMLQKDIRLYQREVDLEVPGAARRLEEVRKEAAKVREELLKIDAKAKAAAAAAKEAEEARGRRLHEAQKNARPFQHHQFEAHMGRRK